jgi:hypothetical protein
MIKNKYLILHYFLNNLRKNELFNKDIMGEYYTYPYEHIRLFNIFNEGAYKEMCSQAYDLCSKVNDENYTTGENTRKYAKIKCLQAHDAKKTACSFFSSELFANFVSEIFDLEITRFFCSSFHLHNGDTNNPSVLGWPHTDLNVCRFPKSDDGNNYLNNMQYDNHLYTSTNMDYDPDEVEHVVRSAAFLFYLNNKDHLKNEDGGGTYLYDNEENIVKTIPPINNSLLLFKVSHSSYHGVQPATFNRYVNVSWFHSDPAQFVHKNFNNFQDKIKKGLNLFEDWDPKNPWNLEKSPNYKNFFKKPLKFISGEEDLYNI